jgi:hypothetical protein
MGEGFGVRVIVFASDLRGKPCPVIGKRLENNPPRTTLLVEGDKRAAQFIRQQAGQGDAIAVYGNIQVVR